MIMIYRKSMTNMEQENVYNNISKDIEQLNEIFSSKDNDGNTINFSQHLQSAFKEIDINKDESINYSIRIIQKIFPDMEIGKNLRFSDRFGDLFNIHLEKKPFEECNKKKEGNKQEAK